MARVGVDLRPASPTSSATDSSRAGDASMTSAADSKESPSTSQTSASSTTPESPATKPALRPLQASTSAQGVKRKFAASSASMDASMALKKPSGAKRQTRLLEFGISSHQATRRDALDLEREVSDSIIVLDSSVDSFDENAGDMQIDSPKKILLQDSVDAVDSNLSVQKVSTPRKKTSVKAAEVKRKSPRIKRIAASVVATTSVLGKRAGDARANGRVKGQALKRMRSLRERPSKEASKPVEQPVQEPPAKKQKITVAPVLTTTKAVQPSSIPKRTQQKKTWLSHGLYVGQKSGFDARRSGTKNSKEITKQEAPSSARRESKVLPMPMFSGEELLKRGRDFKLPFDVFSPLPRGQPKPDEWWKKQANRFIGDAAIEWKKTKPLPPSRCLCQPEDGCNEDCHNRYMLYECDETNCAIGPEFCTNRAFAELKERSKSGKKYDIGVEVVKTAEKGFGVRPCRTFGPNQVIVEYTGEIITQEECERRMREEYKDNECYYLMTFDQNMIIDATRGSIARFVNHSCEPNCRMTKWTVAGKPRVALFAGDNGIMTGEELTYDYNFDPFSQKNVQVCKCGAPTCRGVLGPRPNKEEQAKLKQLAQKAASAVVTGAKEKLKGIVGNEQNSKPKTKAQKLQGTGIWAGKWEWVKMKEKTVN